MAGKPGEAVPVAPGDMSALNPTGSDLADALSPDDESIKLREIMNRMAVSVSVNGKGPFRFLIDSGADRSVIGDALAERLSLPPGKTVRLHGMAGARSVNTVQLSSLQVGSNTIQGIHAPALSETYIGAQGLLGVDALVNQRVLLDFEKTTMTVLAGRRAPPVDEDEIVVTARRRFGQLILAEADIDRDKIYAIIDTGSQVTIGNTALREKVFAKRKNPPPTVPITLISVTGQATVADLAVMPRIRIGGVDMRNVPVAFTDAPPFALFGVSKVPAMLIGTDVLQGFRRVLLDFRDKKVRFQLRRSSAADIVFKD
ncbi:aspartyl protease family protein [Sphingomonas quercus]|nr:aspartyl protease family protein [Sphingomonas quercus]